MKSIEWQGATIVKSVFPEAITRLPRVAIPMEGLTAYLSQADTHQILFMHFESDTDLSEHAHKAQRGIVLEGRIDLNIYGVLRSFSKWDRYYIPEGVRHYGKVYAGYTDMTFFEQKDRYGVL